MTQDAQHERTDAIRDEASSIFPKKGLIKRLAEAVFELESNIAKSWAASAHSGLMKSITKPGQAPVAASATGYDRFGRLLPVRSSS